MRLRFTRWVVICVAMSGLLLTWLFVGYFESYLDDEVQMHFFLKQHPTLRLRFHDIFASEADDKRLDSLSREERAEYFQYCHFRFGTLTDGDQALVTCKQATPPYLPK